MLIKLLLPLAFCFWGFFSARRQLCTEKMIQGLGKTVSYVLLPSVIIAAMANITISKALFFVSFSAIYIVLGLFIVSWACCKFRKLSPQNAGSFLISFSSLEGGSIGLVLTLLFFAPSVLPIFFVFDITHALILFTFTYFIACIYGTKHQVSLKFIRVFFLGPIPLSIVIGLVIHFIFGRLNSGVSTVFYNIGYLILPAVMFILGYRFKFSKQYVLPSCLLMAFKMLVGYVVALSFVLLLHLTDVPRAVIILCACLPPSFLVILFAEEQNLEKDFLSTFLPISAVIGFCFLYVVLSCKVLAQ